MPGRTQPAGTAFVVLFSLLLVCCGELASVANVVRSDPYALDGISRTVPEGQTVGCVDSVAYVTYRGTEVPFGRVVKVADAFVPRLAHLERIAARLGKQFYGRPPHKLLHLGARVCRTVRGRQRKLSEHALGNALDLRGFSFARLPKNQPLPAGAPSALRRPFNVTVLKHFQPDDEETEQATMHRAFLHALVHALRDEDVFRGYVGPPAAGHHNHLHLDCAPWPYARLAAG